MIFPQKNAKTVDMIYQMKKRLLIEFPIVNQLTTLFKKTNIYPDIQYRFSRKKYDRNNIEDIYHGVIYRKKKLWTMESYLIQITFHFCGIQMVYHYVSLLKYQYGTSFLLLMNWNQN